MNEATGPSEEAEAALAAEAGTSLEGTGHRSGVVAGTEIIRQPSEAEQVLRLLTTQLRSLRNLPASSGQLQAHPESPTTCMLTVSWLAVL